MLAEALLGTTWRQLRVSGVVWGSAGTDMGGDDVTRSVEGGADTAVWLADKAMPEFPGKAGSSLPRQWMGRRDTGPLYSS